MRVLDVHRRGVQRVHEEVVEGEQGSISVGVARCDQRVDAINNRVVRGGLLNSRTICTRSAHHRRRRKRVGGGARTIARADALVRVVRARIADVRRPRRRHSAVLRGITLSRSSPPETGRAAGDGDERRLEPLRSVDVDGVMSHNVHS